MSYNDKNSSLEGGFQWVYVNYNPSTTYTTVKAVFLDESQASHVNSTTFNLSYTHELVAHSSQYIVLNEVISYTLKFYKYDYTTGNYSLDTFDSQALSAVFNSSNETFAISPGCEKIRYNDTFFYRDAANVLQQMNNPAGFKAHTTDDSLSYAVATDGKIYRFDNSSNAFVAAYSPTVPFPVNSSIHVYQNRMVVDTSDSENVPVTYFYTSGNSTYNYTYNSTRNTTHVCAFTIETNGSLTLVYNYTNT